MINAIPEKPLPDIIAPNLSILFVGYNPGLYSAAAGHHYAGKSNRFWKLLHESGLLPILLKPEEDHQLLKYGYGSTNIVPRPTKSAAEISAEEFTAGSKELANLIRDYTPSIVCYVGFGVYRAFVSNLLGIPHSKIKIVPGAQSHRLFESSTDYICSNPSGLNTIPYEVQLECFRNLNALKACSSIP